MKEYKIEFTFKSREDMKNMKKYIVDTFGHQALGDRFTEKMKKVVSNLKFLPTGYSMIGFQYRDFDIYMKPYHTYLFFYVVDEVTETVTILRILQDRMDWKTILRYWLKRH